MVIDPIHRVLTKEYSVEAYRQLANDCAALSSKIPGVLSVAIFGSLAKGDIVPAWSDLDLLVFVSRSNDMFTTLSNLRDAIAHARGAIEIGVGVDIVDSAQFLETHRLGGRPTYVSYDVATYSDIRFGPNLFLSLPPIETKHLAISVERPIAVSAELHNWRNAFINSHAFESLPWSARCIKTMLKLLQYKTGPLLKEPFTYEGSLAKMKDQEPMHPMLADFAFAVEARRKWPLLIRQPEELAASIRRVEAALAGYGTWAPGDLL
jgi:predicted nucleotidyltransferase